MSKVDELIREYCPEGVEFKRIKDVFSRIKGTPITAGKMKEISDPSGDVKIFAGGKTVINAFEGDIPNANITRVPAVLVQSRGVIDAVYYDKPFTFKNEMWAYTAEDRVSVKYLYYVLKDNIKYFRDAASGMGSLPQISLRVTEDFKIPVPPLEVQKEIVKILDTFTQLEAELTARNAQYEYYRNQLLTFDDMGGYGGRRSGRFAGLRGVESCLKIISRTMLANFLSIHHKQQTTVSLEESIHMTMTSSQSHGRPTALMRVLYFTMLMKSLVLLMYVGCCK